MGDICLVIVEDDIGLARMLAEALGDEGYRAVAVTDSAQALAVIREAPPQAVLLDLLMPAPSGQDIAAALAADPTLAAIPLIICSALTTVEDEAARLGTPYYLHKPHDLDDLYAVVRRALSATA